MPLMSGLTKFSWVLKELPASSVSCISEELQPGVADGVPSAVLVLVRLGLAAVDLLHPGAGAAEVTTVVGVVDGRIHRARGQRGVLGRGDEVLPGQVRVRVVEQLP